MICVVADLGAEATDFDLCSNKEREVQLLSNNRPIRIYSMDSHVQRDGKLETTLAATHCMQQLRSSACHCVDVYLSHSVSCPRPRRDTRLTFHTVRVAGFSSLRPTWKSWRGTRRSPRACAGGGLGAASPPRGVSSGTWTDATGPSTRPAAS